MDKQLQPKLRFPEFNGDWKVDSFKDIFTFTTGKNIKQKEASPEFKTPCVRYGELYYMYKEVITKTINYTNLDESDLKFSEGDEIILPSAGEDPMDIGSASALAVKNVAIGRTINILKPKVKDVYSSIFASYYINQKLKVKISTLAKGVSISNVYNSDLQTLFIKLPSLPEQQKIADYLTTIDKKIELLTEKKTELSRYKKAMMQKLFSQEIRFKPSEAEALEAYPEWEEKRLGEVGEIITGKTPLTTDKSNWGGEIQFITPSDLNDDIKYVKEIERYVDLKKLKVLPIGTIVYTCIASIGKIGLTTKLSITNQQINSIIILNECNEFVYYFLLFITPYIKSTQANTTLPIINKTEFSKFIIQLPCKSEQQKIADFLSSIDESISKVEEQIKETQNFKKAMLQQMFV